jgi:hypothetical protein
MTHHSTVALPGNPDMSQYAPAIEESVCYALCVKYSLICCLIDRLPM